MRTRKGISGVSSLSVIGFFFPIVHRVTTKKQRQESPTIFPRHMESPTNAAHYRTIEGFRVRRRLRGRHRPLFRKGSEAMADYSIYHNPRCSKSRQALALLEENGIEPNVIKYLDNPPDANTLRALVRQLG